MSWLSQSIRTPVVVLLLLSQAAFAQHGPTRPTTAIPPSPGGHSFGNSQQPTVSPSPEFAPPEASSVDEIPFEQPASAVAPVQDPVFVTPPLRAGMTQGQSGFPFTATQPFEMPVPPAPDVPQQNGPAKASTDRRWSFNFQAAPWMTVLRSFAKETGFSLQIAAEAEGEFTYFDENLYTITEVLDLFNDHLMTSGRILIRDGNRLTLTNATADIPGNLIPFVPIQQIDSLGRNELASVAIPLRNTDPNQAVEEIRQLQSELGQVKALTNSGRVIVTDTGSYLRRMRDLLLGSGVAVGDDQAYVYQLRHAQAEDVARAITDFLSENGSGGGAVGPDGISVGGSSSGTGQRVVAEKTTNSLLVRGTSEEMIRIQHLIADLDRAPRQVLVQALLVEVELGNTNEFGVELGFQDSVLFDRSVVDKLVTLSQTSTAPNGVQTSNQTIISRTAAPGFNFNNQPLGNNVAASPSTIAPQGLSSLGVGRTNGDLGFGGLVLSAGSESVNLLLRALDAYFNIDVLSRPQIRAVENHEALIQIGQQVPVVDGVAITPVGSANPVIRQDQAGIILKVTPRISPDGRVQLDVNAEKSAFNLTPGTGVPIFTDATNGNVIEAPIKDITTADTTVSVQSGQTIVLGGMITNDQTVVVRKVPFLGDIPFLGRLFRYDLNRHKRKELLVFLTPIVLEDDEHSEFVKGKETELMHMPTEAFSFGDNLTGSYVGSMDPQFAPPGQILGQKKSDDASDEAGGSVRSASLARPTAAGHSGSIRQISGETSKASRRASFHNGNAADTNGGVRRASDETSTEKPEKSKSFWSRSPNFRPISFKSKKKEPAESDPAATEPESQFPQAQLSPAVLKYEQSRRRR